jgi:hypothetical protein
MARLRGKPERAARYVCTSKAVNVWKRGHLSQPDRMAECDMLSQAGLDARGGRGLTGCGL